MESDLADRVGIRYLVDDLDWNVHKPKLLFNIDEISAVSIFHDISFTPHGSPVDPPPLNYLISKSDCD